EPAHDEKVRGKKTIRCHSVNSDRNRSLFHLERDHRIDACGTPGRDKTGGDGDDGQPYEYDNKGGWVGGGHTMEQTAHELRQAKSDGEAKKHAGHRQREAAAEH